MNLGQNWYGRAYHRFCLSCQISPWLVKSPKFNIHPNFGSFVAQGNASTNLVQKSIPHGNRVDSGAHRSSKLAQIERFSPTKTHLSMWSLTWMG